jgi:hypothetical protein
VFVEIIKNIPPFLFFLLLAQKKETKKRASKTIPIAIATAGFAEPTHMKTPAFIK